MEGKFLDKELVLGLGTFIDTLTEMSKTCNDNYPPYNIEYIDNDIIYVKLAVAGFKMEDLHITQEDKTLIIKGNKLFKNDNIRYIYKGISYRKFQKKFLLANDLEPSDAILDSGILTVVLARIRNEKKIKTINILTKE